MRRAALSDNRGTEDYVAPSFADGTPASFRILGVGMLPDKWEYREEGNARRPPWGIYENRGTVFTAATPDWARVLAAGHPVVERITHNVIGRLAKRN